MIKRILAFAAVLVLTPFESFASSGSSPIVGSWNCKNESDGVTFESTDTFSRNNTLYSSGLIEIDLPDTEYNVVYSFSLSGKWKMLPGNILESSGDLSIENISSAADMTPEQVSRLRLEFDKIISPETLVKAMSKGSYDQVRFSGQDRFLSLTEGDKDWSNATTCVRN